MTEVNPDSTKAARLSRRLDEDRADKRSSIASCGG
jgi:hypothetical protein